MWHAIWIHLLQWAGVSSSSSRSYNFWSGLGSDIAEFAILGGLISIYRKHVCHQHGCWRFSRHTSKAGHALCHKHIAMPLDSLDLTPIHSSHLEDPQ